MGRARLEGDSHPQPKADDQLNALSGVSTNDLWGVGFGPKGNLTEHWDGVRWRVVPVSTPGAYASGLNAAAAVSPHDVWSFGFDNDLTGVRYWRHWHWNGAAWSVKKENVFSADYPFGAVALTSTDVWVTGFVYGSNMLGVEHWDGSAWSQESPMASSSAGWGITAVGSTLWVVGDQGNGNPKTLTMRRRVRG